jgi:mannose-6-phosphate isomerase-like protein (cupin superfamily)
MYYSHQDILIDKEIVAKVFRFQNKTFKGIKFFTPNNLNLQLGLMSHNKNYIIKPHSHINTKKIIKHMSEILIIFSGKLKVFFYNKKHIRKKNVILKKKDIILLIKGAHGFKVLENLEMLEIKQGPFTGDKDKVRLKNL